MLFIFKITLSVVELTNKFSVQAKRKAKWKLKFKQLGYYNFVIITGWNF